jgi:DNA repair exonuclease SbcCD ATPase subunit
MQDAQIYAERRSELMAELEDEQNRIAKLTPMVAEATQIHDSYGKNLKELERKKKETVKKIQMNTQMKDLYGDLDELRKDTATDKMLSAVLDGSDELEKEADGARIVHENRASTKVARAEQQVAKVQSDAYLESLKKKYNGGN